jgi:transcriptional regulator with XRE-family HTH domain
MATRLRELRQRCGLTQTELADRAGVPMRTLQNWEYARRTMLLEAAVRLAAALGVSVGVLAGTEPMPTPALQGGAEPSEEKPAPKKKGEGRKRKGE